MKKVSILCMVILSVCINALAQNKTNSKQFSESFMQDSCLLLVLFCAKTLMHTDKITMQRIDTFFIFSDFFTILLLSQPTDQKSWDMI